MKRLSLYLFLILFTLQTPSQSDDISEFQIEGMSIGNSALDYFNKKEIKKFLKTYYPKSKKFYGSENESTKYETYDGVQFTFKKKDKTYEIYGLSGYIFFDSSIKECLSKKDEIEKELKSIFERSEIRRYDEGNLPEDTSGKSKQWQTQYLLTNNGGTISIECNDWSEKFTSKHGYTDNLSISIYSKEFENFIKYEAF